MEALNLLKPILVVISTILGVGGITGLFLWLAMRGKPSDHNWLP